MKLIKRFKRWYTFPFQSKYSNLRTPLVWKIVFMFSLPFLFVALCFSVVTRYIKEYQKDRKNFITAYKKFVQEKEL